MNDLDHYIIEVAKMLVSSEKSLRYDWDLITIVFDITDGHNANSGYLYIGEEIIPTSADFDRKIMRQFREDMAEQTGKKFKQLLIQMERETGRINIEYNFGEGDKPILTVGDIFSMSEELRPKFD